MREITKERIEELRYWVLVSHNIPLNAGNDILRILDAAPDLLEACEKLWLRTVEIPVDWRNPEAKELAKNAEIAVDLARAAIAKARGNKSLDKSSWLDTRSNYPDAT